MGMVVRSNIMAVNANRQLGMNNTQVSKSLEKLSSGFKINRAGDDAAGLAISEKMKAQIKGLEQASANSQDGISLIQTAEGALTEVHSMLNRMVELATKSANGTIQNEVDREAIQSEVDALITEIDRIGNSTNFNGIKLLDGTMASISSTASNIKVGNLIATDPDLIATENEATAASTTTSDVATPATSAAGKVTFTVKDAKGNAKTIEVATAARGIAAASKAAEAAALVAEFKGNSELSSMFDIEVDGDAIKFTAKGDYSLVKMEGDTEAQKLIGNAVTLTNTDAAAANTTLALGNNAVAAGDIITVGGKTYEFVAADGDAAKTSGAVAVTLGADTDGTMASLKEALEKNGYTVAEDAGTANTWIFTKKDDAAASGGSAGLTLQIGDTGAAFNMMSVKVDDMRSNNLGISGLDVSTADAARASIDTIKSAINMVSTNRANMGALQNRLEYTINNLDVAAENMSAANSRVRDTDMAKQMMEYTKTNVLTQAAQAMLAQANQQPQSILQLLQ